MAGLPKMRMPDNIVKQTQTEFRGFHRGEDRADTALWDMKNLSGDHYPLLGSRLPRQIVGKLTTPNGLFAKNGLCWVDGTDFFFDGVLRNSGLPLINGKKTFAALGAYIVILPDKAYYNTETGVFGLIDLTVSREATFGDGEYAGEAATANALKTTGDPFPFRVGDGVTISGSGQGENNTTAVIRGISADGRELWFYENTFSADDTARTVTVSRSMPEIDFLCENENHLWGCKGSTIYASKLGDIFNWNVFDNVSTSSYAVDVGSAGAFTGCCSFLGYPLFFKEAQIYKVYGNKPANYQVIASASMGVEAGSAGSLAVAGERLFYLSRSGPVQYTGGIPAAFTGVFGQERFQNAVGGSSGTKYYLSMQEESGAYSLFVCDTARGMWHREDMLQIVGFAWDRALYFLDSGGTLWQSGNPRRQTGEAETAFESIAEFADETAGGANRAGVNKVRLRLEAEANSRIQIDLQFDSDGLWRTAAVLTPQTKRSYYLPIIPRRCDHFRIRITATGQWRLHALTREFYRGSEF